jgi:hypothetical protein
MVVAAGLKRVVVSRNDCLFAGHRVRYLVGPLDNLDTSTALRERLRNIAKDGPSNRIGLFPDPECRRWRFDEVADPASATVMDHAPLAVADPGRTVSDFVTGPGYQPPLRIYLAERLLLIDFDHGLGGGRLMTELIAAVTSDAPAFAMPQPISTCRNPLLHALSHSARTAPRMLAGAFDMERVPDQPVIAGIFDESPVVVYARSDALFLARFRDLRDRDMPGVSVLAGITSAMLAALNSAGISTHPVVEVMVDLGRYLPAECGTLANFLGVAPITIHLPFGARSISNQINCYTTGYRSLVRYGLATLVNMRKPPIKSVVRRCDDSRARLVVTDHGETAAARKIRWAGSEDSRIFVRHAPVGYSNQITLAVNRVRHQLHLSASFYATQFDTDSVSHALHRIVTEAEAIKP